MLTVVKGIVALAIWGVAPLLIGSLWAEPGRERKVHFSHSYIMGIVGEWALFFPLARWAILKKQSLQELCAVWLVCLALLAAGALAYRLWNYAASRRAAEMGLWEVRPVRFRWGAVAGFAAAAALLVGISIRCGGINQGEYTVEEAWTMYATGALYEHDAVTGQGRDALRSFDLQRLADGAKAPVAAYYAANASVCNWNPAKWIRLVLPVFLLPFYLGVYRAWGNYLYGRERWKRIAFQAAVWLFCGFLLFTGQSFIMNIFTNCWNGETLFFMGLLPWAALLALREKDKKRRVLQYLVCMLAGQLLYVSGCFVMTLLWGSVLAADRVQIGKPRKF